MDFRTNRILITGANGWLGKSLVHSLVNGIESCNDLKTPQNSLKIRCLVLPGENTNYLKKQSKNIEIIKGNITNVKNCEQFTENMNGAILFHCAGIIHPKMIKDFYNINVKGTKNIFESAIKNKIKKIIIISSNSPCGTNSDTNHLFNEDSPYKPYLNYGKSKMLMELLVKDYVKKGHIEAVIIRPPWFYGPYMPDRQIRFYNMIRNGKFPIIGSGNNKRSVACTINISQGIIRAAMKNNINGNTYWIADEMTYTFNEIIAIIEDVLENEFKLYCKRKKIKLPSITSDLAYYFDKIYQGLGLYNKEIHVLSEMNKTIACSINKAKKDLNYQPSIDLYHGTTMSIKSSLNSFIN